MNVSFGALFHTERHVGLCCKLVTIALLLPLGAWAKTVKVSSIEELMPYLEEDRVEVTMAPGIYAITADEVKAGRFENPLFVFSGDLSTYDFTGVTFNFETAVLQAFGRADVTQIHVLGRKNVLKNLTMVDVGSTSDAPTWRATNVVIDGKENRVEGFHMTIKGSFPYGYGDLFGKGGGPVIGHFKHCGILVRGDKNHVKDCTLIHRAYGHGIFAQGAYDCLVEGCHVEGEVRSTDDILAEAGTGSPADKVGFMTVNGYKVPPGYMISLQEDGIRSYGMANIYGGKRRDTRNMTVKDCTVDKMRSGVVLTHNSGERFVSGCRTTNCEKGYSIGVGTIVNCSSDARYGPAYRSDYSSDNNVTADITILPAEDTCNGSGLLAYIGGEKKVDITLKCEESIADAGLIIQVGGDAKTKGHLGSDNSSQDNLKARAVVINNQTDCPIVLESTSSRCKGTSYGEVTDNGKSNRIRKAVRPGGGK